VSILNPLYYAVAWVIMRIHAVLAVPFGADSGLAWGLSIVILVILMRLIMVPLFVKQMHAQRKMAELAPQVQELRKKYKSDKQKLNEEMMKLYKDNGANPLAGCMPLALQLPVFFSLFSVLRAIANWKTGTKPLYGLTVPVVTSAKHAHIFGVTLADKFLFSHPTPPLHVILVIILTVALSAVTTFLTMRQTQKRGLIQVTDDNPMAQSQKYMMYIAPFFALTGLYWQYGLVMYWLTTNLWTLGQQHIMFRNYTPPVPGGAAASASAPARSPQGAKAVSGKVVSGKAVAGKAVAGKAAPKTGTKSTSGAAKTAPSGAAKTPPDGTKSAPAGARNAAAAAKSAPAATGGTKRLSDGTTVSQNGNAKGGSVLDGIRRLGRKEPEPEPEPEAPEARLVRQQPVRQSRSKRSGKR
jgi:YidC/Oxa1 family membrane protein insertase